MESFKFLGVHINKKLKWFTHTDTVVKKAQLCLFNLRKLKKFGLSPKTLTNFYSCTIERILSGCITAWYGNCTRPQPQDSPEGGAVCTTHHQGKLPALHDTYSIRCRRKAKKIIKENNHLSHSLFTPLPSRRQGQYRYIKAGHFTAGAAGSPVVRALGQ